MFLEKFMLHSEAEGNGSLGGGDPQDDLTGGEAPPADDSGTPEVKDSIYGDLEVKWPEGMESDIMNDPFLKPYVNKKSGDLNMAGALKSLVHAQRNQNSAKVTIPNENSDQSQWDEFYKKVYGINPDGEGYEIEKSKDSVVTDEYANEFKNLALELRLPPKSGQKILEFLDTKAKTEMERFKTDSQAKIVENLDNLKSEWGDAYNNKLDIANRALKQFGGDEFDAWLAEKGLNVEPEVIKFFEKLGGKLFKEDTFSGESKGSRGVYSPEEARKRIAEIYNDKDHPYHHPAKGEAHRLANKEVQELFKAKNAKR